MSFKDFLQSDLDVFINIEEFAEDHVIDGKVIKCIFDEDIFNERATLKEDVRAGGIFEDTVSLFIKKVDLDNKPLIDEVMTVNGNKYYIRQVIESEGLYEVELMAHTY